MDEITAGAVWRSLPRRDPAGHKGMFGKVMCLCGCVGFTGAPVFASRAAVRTGSGLVYLGVPAAIWQVAAVKSDEAMPFPLPDRDGKLACAGEEEIRRRLMDEPLTPFTPRTITSPQALLEEYANIRKQGYAISDGELNIETIGIGAPVRDESGNVWAAISIGAPRMRVDDAKRERYIFLVTEIAAEMSRDLTRGTVGDSLK